MSELQTLFDNGHQHYLPHLSVDCVIFGFHDNELKVLLLESWYTKDKVLPGGFVGQQESLIDAATRVLKERTGLNNVFLSQFEVFGYPQREQHKFSGNVLQQNGIDAAGSWLLDRFISIGYYALVEYSKVHPQPDAASTCAWWPVNDLPPMYIDHATIVQKALEKLRQSLHFQPVGLNLLPKKFTMPQLHRMYETLFGMPLDRRNFQRKIMATGIIQQLPEKVKGVAYKAPHLYQFKTRQYQKALQAGLFLL